MRIRISVLAVVVGVALLVGSAAPGMAAAPAVGAQGAGAEGARASVIVRVSAGNADEVAAFIGRSGGRVTGSVPMIGAIVCELPTGAVPALKAYPGVTAVTRDGTCSRAGEYSWSPADDPSTPSAPTSPSDPTAAFSARTLSKTAPTLTSTDGSALSPIPTNVFLDTIRARSVWRMWRSGGYITGKGVTIAVIDSGVSDGADFYTSDANPGSTRIRHSVSFVEAEPFTSDANGHGTHVAGVAVGDGSAASGGFSGVAPGARIINLKVSGANAQATEADVLEALQWVYDNREAYGIRVVNLSLNSDVGQSYKESPIDAACEILWFNGVVVVASAGNSGPGGVTLNSAPANDPFVITVGAVDEKYTSVRTDDAVASFSTYGTTSDGFAKPEVYAPGRNIFGTLSTNSVWATTYPDRLDASGKYFRMSGTSVSAPVVAGTVALMLQEEPTLTPDQVKNRLMRASATIGEAGESRPYLDAYSAVTSSDLTSANTGIEVSTLLTTGDESILTGSVMWNSVMWNSVMWNSVMWNSVMWNSVMWNSVMWNSGETFTCQSVMWH